jgi:hypothetical protein
LLTVQYLDAIKRLDAAGCLQVHLLVVCAGYQKLDSLQDLDFEDLDTHWQVSQHTGATV